MRSTRAGLVAAPPAPGGSRALVDLTRLQVSPALERGARAACLVAAPLGAVGVPLALAAPVWVTRLPELLMGTGLLEALTRGMATYIPVPFAASALNQALQALAGYSLAALLALALLPFGLRVLARRQEGDELGAGEDTGVLLGAGVGALLVVWQGLGALPELSGWLVAGFALGPVLVARAAARAPEALPLARVRAAARVAVGPALAWLAVWHLYALLAFGLLAWGPWPLLRDAIPFFGDVMGDPLGARMVYHHFLGGGFPPLFASCLAAVAMAPVTLAAARRLRQLAPRVSPVWLMAPFGAAAWHLLPGLTSYAGWITSMAIEMAPAQVAAQPALLLLGWILPVAVGLPHLAAAFLGLGPGEPGPAALPAAGPEARLPAASSPASPG